MKLPSKSQKYSFSHRVHRRTEHTGFHRDIKSTDYTEPYSHLWQLRSVISVCRRPSVDSKLCAKRVCQICEFCERKTPHELNSTQKVSVRSVSSVREKTLQRERKNLYEVCKQPNRGNLTYYAPRHSEKGWG